MAKTPATTKSAKAAPTPATKALAKWDDRMAKYATEVAATEKTSGKFISTKGGVLTYGGAQMPGNKMTVVILDHIMENHLYSSDYDAGNPSSPVCFAFGRNGDEMAPHDDSSEPQNDACKGCPANQWGSAEKGRGKACKNIRRLAMLTEEGLEDIESAEVAYLRVPVTSVRAWAGYVQSIATNMRRPPFGVVTEIGIVPDPSSQFRLTFTHVQNIEEDDVLEALEARREKVGCEIDFPYAVYEAAPAPKAAKFAPKPAAKAAAAPKFAAKRR